MRRFAPGSWRWLALGRQSVADTHQQFNGVRLPSIAVIPSGCERAKFIRQFGYDEYRRRLS